MKDSDILLGESRHGEGVGVASNGSAGAAGQAGAGVVASASGVSATMPPAPGGRLRSERERRGWILIDAAEKLRLEPAVVQALEDNDFAKLGPAVFARGHLKQYATLLGLPLAEMIAAYEELQRRPVSARAAAAAAVDDQHTPFPEMAASGWFARRPGWALPAAGGALLILIAAGLLLWSKPWRHGVPPMVENSQGAAIAPSLEQPANPVTPIVESAPAEPAAAAPGSAAAAGAAPATPASAAGRLRLRMSFSADSWVEVRDAAGAMVYRGKGAANSVKVIAGAAPLNVYLGSVSGVQLEINNHAVAIGPQFVRGEKARFEAGADGVLRRGPRT